MTHVFDLLSAHLDGELTAAEETVVVTHLADCERCRDELEGVAQVREVVRSLPQLDPPIPLVPALRRQRRWITTVASVAAGALAVGLAFGPGEPASTFDLDTMAGQHTTRTAVDPGISTLRASAGAP